MKRRARRVDASATTPVAPSPAGRLPVLVAVATVSVLALVDAANGAGLVVPGLLAVGPCLAALSARPGAVTAVGGYALALITFLAWGPDQIWGTAHQLLYTAATVAVTAISVLMAAQRRRLERYLSGMLVGQRTAEAIMQNSDDAIIAKSLDGTITAWNPGAERLYGYPAAQAVGMNIAALAGEAETSAVLAQIAAGQHVDHYETQRTHRDGSTIDVSVRVSPIRDQTGQVVGASVVARDVSARKREEERRRALEDRSQQAQRLQSLGQLAGGVAHDFNNLLTVILNYTDLLADRVCGDPEARADLSQIQTAADRATGLTRQLLLFGRGEVARTQVVDLNAAVAEACRLLTPTLGETIELIARRCPQPVYVNADSGQIQQLLVNLAVNARDAMPSGGVLIVEAGLTQLDEKPEWDPPLPAGQYSLLTVSDTGVGMSKEVTAHILEPFYTTKPRGQGIGLGLATVHRIVTDAGGGLSVYSEPDLGTTFRVYLPAAQPPDPVPPHAPTTGRGTAAWCGPRQTILLVEDEDALRQAITRILHRGGYRVLAADSPAHALELDRAEPCQLLLTDVVMPDTSGPQLAAKLRRIRPHLPILYMSGYNDGLINPQYTKAKNVDFIRKPFTAGPLLDRLATLIAGSQPDDDRSATANEPVNRSGGAPTVAIDVPQGRNICGRADL